MMRLGKVVSFMMISCVYPFVPQGGILGCFGLRDVDAVAVPVKSVVMKVREAAKKITCQIRS